MKHPILPVDLSHFDIASISNPDSEPQRRGIHTYLNFVVSNETVFSVHVMVQT